MLLSRAEIQKRYREKKKSDSGSYAKKERERKRKAYVPVALLSETEVKKRRKETPKRGQNINHELLKTDNKTRQNAKGTRKVKESTASSVGESSPQNVNTDVHLNETENKSVHVVVGDFCAAVFEQD
ncbi:hypothetical protein ACF0H5_022747 [Mactra antiquata]